MVSATVSNPAGDIVETYTYDYLGNRTSKTSNGVTTKFTTDLSSGYAQVLKAEKDSEVTYYTRGFELISKTTNGETVFYLYDGGSSVRALTDESGAVTDTLVFDAFGNETEKTGTTENSYGFQGEEQDATGLYYLRARYMDPSTGTFTSMDTYGGSLTDPMSLHKYLFANSNPVQYCDPSGHLSLTEFEVSTAIDEILMSSLSYGFAYAGIIQSKETSLTDGQKIAGYLGALGLGMIMPFFFAGVALLPFVAALIIMIVVAGTMTVGSVYADMTGHEIASVLMGLVAGDTVGRLIGLLIGKAIDWIKGVSGNGDLIHISSEEAEGSGTPKTIDDEIDEWYNSTHSDDNLSTQNGTKPQWWHEGYVDDLSDIQILLGVQQSGKGLSTLGSATRNNIISAGNAWVGENSKPIIDNGKIIGYASEDGLRAYRIQYKAGEAAWRANFTQNVVGDSGVITQVKNVHIDIIG